MIRGEIRRQGIPQDRLRESDVVVWIKSTVPIDCSRFNQFRERSK